jgi:hypothetical protein
VQREGAIKRLRTIQSCEGSAYICFPVATYYAYRTEFPSRFFFLKAITDSQLVHSSHESCVLLLPGIGALEAWMHLEMLIGQDELVTRGPSRLNQISRERDSCQMMSFLSHYFYSTCTREIFCGTPSKFYGSFRPNYHTNSTHPT